VIIVISVLFLLYLILGVFFFTLPFALLGLYVLVKTIFMNKRLPMDKTNRINHLRLLFFALQDPADFIGQPAAQLLWCRIKLIFEVLAYPERYVDKFAWLKRDEGLNLK
jgi:hypothetical protein